MYRVRQTLFIPGCSLASFFQTFTTIYEDILHLSYTNPESEKDLEINLVWCDYIIFIYHSPQLENEASALKDWIMEYFQKDPKCKHSVELYVFDRANFPA